MRSQGMPPGTPGGSCGVGGGGSGAGFRQSLSSPMIPGFCPLSAGRPCTRPIRLRGLFQRIHCDDRNPGTSGLWSTRSQTVLSPHFTRECTFRVR